ncbi:hypothetical protein SAMN05192563_103915 [Paraburkholderia aspalathi]|uniref:Uncharacterized protein n=1 Tax=Paraburkholderia aspalathi TaxID=1324617 RepID=A0A1I7ENX3_9BURK|nr:hypothetical protein SAMN05192563_103915 [Paraburkholderia aspalathi]
MIRLFRTIARWWLIAAVVATIGTMVSITLFY